MNSRSWFCLLPCATVFLLTYVWTDFAGGTRFYEILKFKGWRNKRLCPGVLLLSLWFHCSASQLLLNKLISSINVHQAGPIDWLHCFSFSNYTFFLPFILEPKRYGCLALSFWRLGLQKGSHSWNLVVYHVILKETTMRIWPLQCVSLCCDEKTLHNCTSEWLMQREASKDGLDGRHGLVHFLYLHSDTCTKLKRKSVKSLYHDLRQPCRSSCPERQSVRDSGCQYEWPEPSPLQTGGVLENTGHCLQEM